MKKLISLITLLLIQFTNYSQSSIDSLIMKSTEEIPQEIQNNFPHFAETIKNAKKNDGYITKIYFGDYYSKGFAKTNAMKGIILIDKSFVLNKESKFDNAHTWSFLMSIGSIHYAKDNKNSYDPFLEAKSKFVYSLNFASEIINQTNYCEILRYGLNKINAASKQAADRNIRSAAEELLNDNVYKTASDLAISKGCTPTTKSNQSTIEPSKNENQPVEQKQATETKIENTNTQIADKSEAIKQAFDKLQVTQDDITNKIFYHDKRTSWDYLTGEGLYASLYKLNNKYVLRLTVYHIAHKNSSPRYITKIIINDGSSEPIKLEAKLFEPITTNRTMSFSKENPEYKILKNIVTNNSCKIRFVLAGSKKIDYELSNREIKEIKTVLDAWELVNNLN